jgi:ABC-type transport system involved in Fe-S cluster assembly fused permease/ATPase subunit
MRKFQYVARSMTVAEETLAAVRTVRGFNRESMETARFMHETRKAERQDVWIGGLVHGMFATVVITLWILIVGCMIWGGRMVLDGMLLPGDLFATFGMLLFNNFALIELQTSLQAEQKAVASGGRILDYTERKAEINFAGGKKIKDFKGHIEFRNVSFRYPSRDVYVLRNVSFTIEPGQMGALVGHSGSGKSTCVQLLERFYDVTEGVILLDGEDIRTLDPRWLHHKIALVAQEPILFQMTIRENVKYGKRKATDEEVEAAIETANARKFVSKMEKGLDTVVGEKGSTLSGGQRQRIAIARAVIRDPIILMTDEATSALDAASEKRVQLALDKVMEGRTAVVVAHRLSTIRNANIIYVFDTGEIKEQGTHDELVAKKEWYYELVKRQLTEADMQLAGVAAGDAGGLIAPPDIGARMVSAAAPVKKEGEGSSSSEPSEKHATEKPPPKAAPQEESSSSPESSEEKPIPPTAPKTAPQKESDSSSSAKSSQKRAAEQPSPQPPSKPAAKKGSNSSSSTESTEEETERPQPPPPVKKARDSSSSSSESKPAPQPRPKPPASDTSSTDSSDTSETNTESSDIPSTETSTETSTGGSSSSSSST